MFFLGCLLAMSCCSLLGKCGDSTVATGEQTQRIFPIEIIQNIIANASE